MVERISIETLKNRTVLAAYIATLATGLAAYAISKGIDGTLLATVFALLGGLGGWSITSRKWAQHEELYGEEASTEE